MWSQRLHGIYRIFLGCQRLWGGADLSGLLACLSYPFLAVFIGNNLVTGEGGNINESKPAEAAEHECVTHKVQPWQCRQVEFHYCFQLILGQKFTLGFGTGVTLADKRIIVNPLVGYADSHHVFEIADIFHGGIVGALLTDTEKMLEVIHHTGREFFHRYVVHTLLAEQEFFQIHHAAFPAQYRGFAYIATLVLLPHLHIDLAESLAEHLRLFEFAEEGSFKHVGIYEFVAHDELVMYLADFRSHRVKVAVPFKVFLCLALRLTF